MCPLSVASPQERPIVNPFESGNSAKKVAELQQDNAELKKELSELTQTYQEQM